MHTLAGHESYYQIGTQNQHNKDPNAKNKQYQAQNQHQAPQKHQAHQTINSLDERLPASDPAPAPSVIDARDDTRARVS